MTEPASGDARPYAAIDLDGVVADTRHRLRFVQSRPKDWDRFFAAAPEDPLLPEGAAVVRTLEPGHEVVYVTGRPERCREDTVAWLAEKGLPAGRLVMRRTTDRRPAMIVKVELLRRLARDRPVAVLVDDDRAVVAAAAAAGFPTMLADWMVEEPDLAGTLFEVQEDEGRS